jgi:hypothetical protein
MINLKGEVTNAQGFHKSVNTSFWRATEDNKYEVTCSITGNIILDSEAIEIEKGVFVWVEAAKQILKGAEVSKDKPEVTVEDVSVEEDDEFDADIDLGDF